MMKAISLRQPWANMIARGQKTIETRKWSTRYRGPLLIVSSKEPAIEPVGMAVALVRLVDIRRMVKTDETAACCPLYPGAFAWIIEDIKRVKPFPVKGHLGIYEVDAEQIITIE